MDSNNSSAEPSVPSQLWRVLISCEHYIKQHPALPSQSFHLLLLQLCCPCCVATTDWRITGQGIRWKKNRASINCCGNGIYTVYINYI